MHTAPILMVLGTGGTIAGRAASARDHIGYRAGEVPVAELLGELPLPQGWTVAAEQVAQIDSKDMDEAVWRRLLEATDRCLRRDEVGAVVITHGTDTLEETAYLLQRVLNPAKPVVMVSAMRPATASLRDGLQNLADGLELATRASVRGVLAVCAGRVHAGWDVSKVHNHRLDAYDSGDAGPVAMLEEGRLRQWRAWPQSPPEAHDPGLLGRLLHPDPWPRVEWITSHGGQTGALVRALLQPPLSVAEAPVQGLVVAGTGNGTLHRDLLSALLQAMAQGVQVWRSTRCASGSVIEGGDSPIAATPLSPAKARLELMLQLR
jgi:L-asparaginase